MMAKRDNYTQEQWERERLANRHRMARRRAAMSREERSAEAASRKQREAEKAIADPVWAELRRSRASATARRYYESRRGDPVFWQKRQEYLRRWRQERRDDEAFEAFIARIEAGDAVTCNGSQIQSEDGVHDV